MRGGSNFYWIRVRSFVVVEFGVNPIWLLRVKLGAMCCGKPDRGAGRPLSKKELSRGATHRPFLDSFLMTLARSSSGSRLV